MPWQYELNEDFKKEITQKIATDLRIEIAELSQNIIEALQKEFDALKKHITQEEKIFHQVGSGGSSTEDDFNKHSKTKKLNGAVD